MKVKADDPRANYMGPDKAPFQCSHCKYFFKDNHPCEKVSDPIRAFGCCNLYQMKERKGVLD